MIRSTLAIASLAACAPIKTDLVFALESGCSTPGMMNTYAVTLFETQNGVQGTYCDECIAMGNCKPVGATQCMCGPDQAADTANVEGGVMGVRFEDVDPQYEYCVRVIALEEPGPPPATSAACTCPSLADLAQTGRVCLLSRIGTINDANASIAISQTACQGSMGFATCTTPPKP